MAFLDLSEPGYAAAARAAAAPRIVFPASVPATAADVALTFSSLEHRVLELARGESLASLRAPRKRSLMARLILGPTPPSKLLANERLEALRRLAVRAWHHGYTLPVSALREANKAGFSESQVGWVIDQIGRSRVQVRRVAG
ncbi:hypothetical protein WSK_0418 [Novosphingobium sp. Rr 2-17]|uniref:hypothetical protein n=1 Tax=Novosphingobium sp. Rr 2-17 TaxID=555793 RepID=UPI00026994CA|nr:hypothetical protein [Novosphingobium sp. Rr 2-17]EIZ81026.1 hypothetical protein WSK_0418 [Novosphingobium sp. Rr 2-17]